MERTARTRRSLRRALALALALSLALVGGVASAYWRSTGTGTGSVRVGTLNAPTNVTATSAAYSGSVSVSWTAPTGTAPTGYRVTRTLSGVATYTCGTSASTTISATSCTDSPVADGTYTYTVTAIYRSWTAAATSAPVAVTNRQVTTTTLAVSNAAPVVGETITYTATVTTGGSPVTSGSVSFATGGPSCAGGTPSLDAAGKATCTVAYATQGTRNATASYDGVPAFAPSTSAATSVMVGAAATKTVLTSSQSPVVKGDKVTYTATVTVLAPGSGTPSGSVTFKDGGSAITCTGSNPVTLSNGTASCETIAAQSGTRTISADFAAATGYAASSATVNQGVRPNKPGAISIASDTGSSSTDFVTRTSTQTLSVTTEPGASVTFTKGGSPVATVTANAGGVATTPTLTLAEGDNDLSATATVGGFTSDAVTQLVRLDSKAPTAVNVTVTGGTTGTNGWFTAAPTVSATGTDPDPSSGIVLTEVSVNGGTYVTGASAKPTAEGTTSYSFRVTDLAGNSLTQATATQVKLDTVAPTATPSVTGTSGTSPWWIGTGAPQVTLAASDATSGVVTRQYSTDGGTTWPTYTIALSAPEGTTTYAFRVVDEAGLVGTASQKVQYDKTNPAGTVTFPTSSTTNNNFAAGCGTAGVNDICGTASDAGSGVAKVEFTLRRDGNGQSADQCLVNGAFSADCTTRQSTNGTTSWSAGVPNLPGLNGNRKYRLTVYVTDGAGNGFTTPEVAFAN